MPTPSSFAEAVARELKRAPSVAELTPQAREVIRAAFSAGPQPARKRRTKALAVGNEPGVT